MVRLRWLGHSAWQVTFKAAIVIIDSFLSTVTKPPWSCKKSKALNFVYVRWNILTTQKMPSISVATQCKAFWHIETYGWNRRRESKMKMPLAWTWAAFWILQKIRVGITPATQSDNMVDFEISADRKTVYYKIDTPLFTDMMIITELYKPDVALLPIGGFYTIDPWKQQFQLTSYRRKGHDANAP